MGDYWRGGGLEDSSDLDGASPPAYSSGDGFGFKAKQQAQKKGKTSGEDEYDFEIEGADGSDEDLDLGGYQPRAGLKSSVDNSVDRRRAGGDTRRKSTDQRMMEIIARSKEHAASKSQADSAASGAGVTTRSAADRIDEVIEDETETGGVGQGGTDSWKSSWDNLMEGLNSPSTDKGSPAHRGSVADGKGRNADSDIGSPYNSDSMEISASDFQAGADAARRAKEKTQTRQRRQALDEAPHIVKEREEREKVGARPGVPMAKIAASPDVSAKHRQARELQQNVGVPPNFKISTALSSIQKSADSLQVSQDGSDGEYMGHGGVAASRGDGDLYKMLGGRDSTTNGPVGRYSRADYPGRGRDSSNVSDFSTSGEVKMGGSSDTMQGRSSSDDSENDEDGSGDSELAQSADFATARERRSGFSGPSSQQGRRGNQNQVDLADDMDNNSSDEYNSEDEKERRRKMEAELAMSAEEREEKARLRKMEEIRQRWLNPDKAAVSGGNGIAAAASGSALDILEESTGDRKAVELSQESASVGLNETAGSDLPETEADKRLKAEAEALLMQQMVDPNPANANVAAEVVAPSLSNGKLITAVGSASMVTSVPPPPPPITSASEDSMVLTSVPAADAGPGAGPDTVSRNSMLYSDSDRSAAVDHPDAGDDGIDASLGQESVLRGLQVGTGASSTNKDRYSHADEDSPERASPSSPAPAPAPAPKDTGKSKPDVTQHPTYQHNLAQYAEHRGSPGVVTIAHELDVGDSRDSLRAGQDAGAVDAHGRRAASSSGSSGQPFLNKVVAMEIDPATLGLPNKKRSGARAEQKSREGGAAGAAARQGANRPPPPPAPTSWPKELPMSNPTSTDLHAHLAMMESSEAKRILAVKAQAAKIREIKKVNKKANATSASGAANSGSRRGSRGVSGGPGPTGAGSKSTLATSAVKTPGMNRLEAGTARLARQFEMLEKELKQMKASRGTEDNQNPGAGGGPGGVTIAAGITPASVGGYVGAIGGSGQSVMQPSPARNANTGIPVAAPRADRINPADLGIAGASARSSTDSRAISGGLGADDSRWEGEALSTMRKIVEEGDRLDEKAKALNAREEALRVREAMVDMDLRNPNRAGRMRPGSTNKDNGDDDLEKHPLVEELRAVEKTQAEEIASLKAKCFQLQNSLEGEGGDDEGSEGLDDTRRKRKEQAYTSLQDRDAAAAAAAAAGEETVTVPKAKYDALLDEIKSQEALIEGYQKENEKLLANLRSMESEYNREKAKFYDQREEINRDLNRLRNATGETAYNQLTNKSKEWKGGASGNAQGMGGGWGVTGAIGMDKGLEGVRRSAQDLREELDTASTIFNLKEQLAVAESKSGHREKEMQKTIERLRQDLRDMQSEAAGISAKTIAGLNAEKQEQEATVRGLEAEIGSLKRKLVWYTENQQLIDQVEADKGEMQSVQTALKRELRRRGMDAPSINALVSLARDHKGASPPSPEDNLYEEDSMLSAFGSRSTTGRSKSGGSRNHADVKRIKELEAIVEDLQDSMRKRHPDSVSNLVRAATVSEEVQEERKISAGKIERLQQELVEAKEDYDHRLRSLRQDHDKLKLGYEGRIADLEGMLASVSPGKAPAAGAAATPTSSNSKTLASAQARIAELEEETVRIRTFYTKKVEETQKKADAQIHALKRASPVSTVGNTSDSGDKKSTGSGDVDRDTVPINPTGTFAISDEDREANLRAELSVEYNAQMDVLRKQITQQAAEIGSLRANSRVEALLAASGLLPGEPLSSASSSATSTPTPATPAAGLAGASPAVVERIKASSGMTPLAAAIAAEAKESIAGADSEEDATKKAVESLLAAAKSLSPVPIRTTTEGSSASASAEITAEQVRASPLWQSEMVAAVAAAAATGTAGGAGGGSSELTRRLREEEMRASQLMNEVLTLRAQLLNAPAGLQAAPTMPAQMPVGPATAMNAAYASQLATMEKHVGMLEKRLSRRESELISAIEETKTASKMERARLEALHQYELREKDEQLVRFQQELEQLVYCLRQWQMEAQSKGGSSTIAGTESAFGVALPGMPPSPATSLMPVPLG